MLKDKIVDNCSTVEHFLDKWKSELKMRNHLFINDLEKLTDKEDEIKFIVKIKDKNIYAVFLKSTYNELIKELIKNGES